MGDIEYRDSRVLPRESEQERDVRTRLTKLLTETPIPPVYLIDNLPVYLRRHQLADLLAMDALYRMLPEVPGVIMEFGVLHGRHLAILTALRALHEPYNSYRRIIGFDTFTGFPEISEIDQASPSAAVGRFAVPDGEVEHLREVLAAHEAGDPVSHVQRTFVVQGDVRETLPQYLRDNPETVIGMVFFDLDLYEPTREALRAIRPCLAKGSIIAFDELGHPRWPGVTAAVREGLGLEQVTLRQIPGREQPVVYLRWGE
ncbi:class I SAM-dependent methyltransferase [Crossiella sp. CA-258035]|uniref:class I SAM-dependent methyltransferase n=1 Tax=Crossiella sp. CA-258035 TaxID=2981138 RepID=UPI0024BC2846|nr:class I SAM-dependent methyltransferase [Crossiella sp. CA-258035]WHT23354.1 class I SAM-dependent methyltransferase [Crossiella sp. CA-258035]